MRLVELVQPLEDAWQDVLDAVLRARGAPTTGDVARLAPRVAELSAAYNAGHAGRSSCPAVPLDARIGFSFARDVPKGAAAVRELVAASALVPAERGRPLRVVDLGAGLGAMTWGIARAARASGIEKIEALLIDEDAAALSAAEAIGREAGSRPDLAPPRVELRTRSSRLGTGMKLPEADVVILGQVLSELDLDLAPAERVARHVALARDLLDRVVAPKGALVIVEPALRDRTRHLHAVRDALVTGDAAPTLFGPCLHAAACPALALEGEWCHEDLAVDLPSWLVPLARGAGLRWQGLTSSVLVFRRDGLRLRDLAQALGAERGGDERQRLHLRVVSDLITTKGKSELFACTAAGARVRLRRLDRDAGTMAGRAGNAAWEELRRGDVVALTAAPATARTSRAEPDAGPAVDDRGRVAAHVAVDVWPGWK